MRLSVVPGVGRFFSLLDERLALGTEGYSAALVAKIEYAGANEGSFGQACEALKRLAELPISAKHVQRITERLGQERTAQRDRQVERMKAGQLAPQHAQPPRVAARANGRGNCTNECCGRPGQDGSSRCRRT